ncbi:MAG: DUF4162 domain-containing protein, partial [Clostridium sp.]|nr:DUF4162 domain-containing protein [Clostridium sp.]
KRLILAAENLSPDELERKIAATQAKLLTVCGRTKEALILQPADGVDKKTVLSGLAQMDIALEYFGNYNPSLNDIFVEVSTRTENKELNEVAS